MHYTGSGVGVLPRGQVDRHQHDAPRAAAAVRQRRGDRARPARRGRQREALRPPDEREGQGARPLLHPLHDARAASSTRATTPAPATSPRSPAPCCASRGWRRSSSAAGGAAVPDQGRAALALQPQPAAARELPGHDRAQDRLHGRRGPLPGRHRDARPGQARRRAPALPGPRQAGDAAARSRLRRLRSAMSG